MRAPPPLPLRQLLWKDLPLPPWRQGATWDSVRVILVNDYNKQDILVRFLWLYYSTLTKATYKSKYFIGIIVPENRSLWREAKALETAGSSDLELRAGGREHSEAHWDRYESFDTSKPTPSGIIPSVRPPPQILCEQPVRRNQAFKCARRMGDISFKLPRRTMQHVKIIWHTGCIRYVKQKWAFMRIWCWWLFKGYFIFRWYLVDTSLKVGALQHPFKVLFPFLTNMFEFPPLLGGWSWL